MKSTIGSTYHYWLNQAETYVINMMYVNKMNRKLRSLKHVPHLNQSQKNQIKELYKKSHYNYISYQYHRYYYAKTGAFDARIIPENLFHLKIRPALNNMVFAKTWKDKSYYDLFLPQLHHPKTYIRNINGIYFDQQYHPISYQEAKDIISDCDDLVIKPTLISGQGRNVKKILVGENIDDLFKTYHKDFIVQQKIDQHPILSSLNASSVNSIRITSLLKDGQVYVFAPFLRIGEEGQFADNYGSQRFFVGIYEDGTLNTTGYDSQHNPVTKLKNGICFADVQIPSFEKIVDQIKRVHPIFAHTQLLFWDFSVSTTEEPIFIECNFLYPDVTTLQLICGPMFQDQVDLIIQALPQDIH